MLIKVKKFQKFFMFIFVLCSFSTMANTIDKELMEKFREKIKIEEQKKVEELKKLEETRLEEERIKEEERQRIEREQKLKEENEKKEAMKLLKEKRREYSESLQDKVYRPGNNMDKQLAATERAFKVGEERISFTKVKEENLMNQEKALGIEKDHSSEFISEKFDKLNEKYKSSNEEVAKLLKQREEIKENLKKLEEMEKKIKQ
ncbi:hypothetical protein SAMN02983009_01634 [Fusobacterium necrophorum]|uniref:Stress response protein NST1 n=1 Tax=Fusobacterium necrophorum BL TaxID=1441732 RepID=A0AB73BVC5_9FUSO|nr:hypothetical protein [Fusobacterium necrophorum]AZW09447.1 hypothetical protein EO219_07640 [Fusobacterium necrophorum subsp. necrophorum]KDE62593.1 hypothetical protein FUSO3_07470 [Fusobacterium necrophorum BL]SDB33990.1 hypothetical protein SAMN02983009_01634 [Fusobacterium necrophorum]SQD10510.1 Uncharacterised protein [Fusobacterium necrophorum subsp. necrophorum]